jgi:ferritin
MSNLTKLKFVALDISGKNYLSWILDAEIHLEVMNFRDIIKNGNQASPQNHAKAMIFIRHHLHEELKTEYLTVKDPLIL